MLTAKQEPVRRAMKRAAQGTEGPGAEQMGCHGEGRPWYWVEGSGFQGGVAAAVPGLLPYAG